MWKAFAATLLMGGLCAVADSDPHQSGGPTFNSKPVPMPADLPEPPPPESLDAQEDAAPAPLPQGDAAPRAIDPRSTAPECPCGRNHPMQTPGATVYSFRPHGAFYGHPPAMPPMGVYGYTGAAADGVHPRYPYYSYRRPWYTPGPASRNVTILW
jgi:hypothetical protein